MDAARALGRPAAVKQARLSAVALSKTYENGAGALPVIARLDFDVACGELLAIVGPSGCGKTTLLSILGALLPPTEGSVILDGAALREASRDIAYVFQEDSLFPWKTALGNVAFALEGKGEGGAAAARKAREFITMVGLSGFENFYPAQLSGGMKQRIALARALAVEPRILLLDEPFASLDPLLRERLQEELLALHRRLRVTAVLVSHDIEEVVFLADRVMVLSDRPARLVKTLAIDLPSREAGVRASQEFLGMKTEIWRILRGTG